jgi:surfactin synthase thioesterase subunit
MLLYFCGVNEMNLWMFSFGGGNETSFSRFEEYLPEHIKLRTFSLPGKGARIKEPQLRNLYLIVDEHFDQIRESLNTPFAFYGHSMGTYVAHLLIQRLRDEGLPLPLHAFLTSKVAPSLNKDLKRSLLDDNTFISRLKTLKGMPDFILNNEDMLRIFLPIIRNDFYAIDTYRYRKALPYPVDLSVFCGSEEAVDDSTLSAWQEETSGNFHFKRYEGAHFWIFNHLPELCTYISQTLDNYRK